MKIVLDLEVPANSQAEFQLPATKVNGLVLNGENVSADSLIINKDNAGAYIALKLNSGSHSLEF